MIWQSGEGGHAAAGGQRVGAARQGGAGPGWLLDAQRDVGGDEVTRLPDTSSTLTDGLGAPGRAVAAAAGLGGEDELGGRAGGDGEVAARGRAEPGGGRGQRVGAGRAGDLAAGEGGDAGSGGHCLVGAGQCAAGVLGQAEGDAGRSCR